MAPPRSQEKTAFGFTVRMQTYIRRQPSCSAQMDYSRFRSLSVDRRHHCARKKIRFSESRSDHFAIGYFFWQPFGGIEYKSAWRVACTRLKNMKPGCKQPDKCDAIPQVYIQCPERARSRPPGPFYWQAPHLPGFGLVSLPVAPTRGLDFQ